MAVTVLKNNGGPLGSLGSFGMALGTLTGQPWLTALGTGMKATDSLLNGNNGVNTNTNNIGALQEALKGLWEWVNPASDNIAKSASQRMAEKVKNLTWEV